MHNYNPYLSTISKITDNIFLSGIYPLADNLNIIKKMKIKYILSCVRRDHVANIHNNIISVIPDITILYLPYDDKIDQNLWTKNNNMVQILKYNSTSTDHDNLAKQLRLYRNKPMIEIAYHFVNTTSLLNENILVHCMAGVSRSVSMVTYFLMKKYFVDFETAIKIIKDKRPIVNPNSSFKLQLKHYYKKKDQFTKNDAAKIINDYKSVRIPHDDQK